MFETERVLRPLPVANDEDEIATLTAWCRERGMPSGHVVFHEGFRYTAIRCTDGAYVSFDGEVQMCGEYISLDHWYTQLLRSEYASKYGLPGLAGV